MKGDAGMVVSMSGDKWSRYPKMKGDAGVMVPRRGGQMVSISEN